MSVQVTYILGAVIITLLVLLISAINTILIVRALLPSQPKRYNSRKSARREGRFSNGIH